MLKKAGILVAATAAGLLAVSPLAFAGEKGYEGHGDETSFHYEEGDVDITDSSVNDCENDQSTDDDSVNGGGLLLGAVGILNNTNANVLQCANILNNFLNDNNVDVL